MTYRLVDSDRIYHGKCTSLDVAKVSFIADLPIATGKGLEIHVHTNNPATPSMIAFIETHNVVVLKNGKYEVSASIKIIKGR